jgi:hypothetical protein
LYGSAPGLSFKPSTGAAGEWEIAPEDANGFGSAGRGLTIADRTGSVRRLMIGNQSGFMFANRTGLTVLRLVDPGYLMVSSDATNVQANLYVNGSGLDGSVLVVNSTGSRHFLVNSSNGFTQVGTQFAVGGAPYTSHKTTVYGSSYWLIGGNKPTYLDESGSYGTRFYAQSSQLNLESDAGVVLHPYNSPLLYAVSGAVGIGTSAPSSLLELANESNTIGNITNLLTLTKTIQNNTNGTNGDGVSVLFRAEDSVNTTENISMIVANFTTATNGSETSSLSFYTRTGGGNLTQHMQVSGAGKVGIGMTPTSDPAKLQLNGTLNVTTGNISVQMNYSMCFNENCSARIYFNGTALVMQG